MGLLTILRKQKLRDKEIRILMLGFDNAGKTTIVKSILNEDVKEVSPTLGFNIHTVPFEEYRLNIWDVGGQSSLRPFWRNYFEKTDFLIWVVDASALHRLQDVKRELHAILNEDRLVGAGLLVWVNKIDTLGDDRQRIDETVRAVQNELDLANMQNHSWRLLGCSAYTGENLNEGLAWAVEEVKARLYLLD